MMSDRATHLDLLEQVADSTRERDEVRRILYSPSDADVIWPNCCGSCQQGRRACPTPQACQISTEPDRPRPRRKPGDTAIIVALLVSTWAAVAFALVSMFYHP